MFLRIVKTVLYIFVFGVISFTVVYLLNKSNLDLAQQEVLVITPTNYKETKDSIKLGSVVKITGTPDLLKQVSQESKETSEESANTITYYYASLKEYESDFVVRMKPGKISDGEQTFNGKVIQLSQSDFGTRVKNALNNPINFDDEANASAAKELDSESKNAIAESSKGDFKNETFLVLDEEAVNSRQVVLGIALWTTVLALFLITIFRRIVFQMK